MAAPSPHHHRRLSVHGAGQHVCTVVSWCDLVISVVFTGPASSDCSINATIPQDRSGTVAKEQHFAIDDGRWGRRPDLSTRCELLDPIAVTQALRFLEGPCCMNQKIARRHGGFSGVRNRFEPGAQIK